MNGKDYEAGYHAATLRRYLWREHLGLLHPQELDANNDPNAQPLEDCPNDPHEGETYEFVADPLSNEVWDMWTRRATKNTQVFEELFHTDPANCSKYTRICSVSRLIQILHSPQMGRLQQVPTAKRQKARPYL
jgi:phospholipase D1/2